MYFIYGGMELINGKENIVFGGGDVTLLGKYFRLQVILIVF